MFAAWGRFVYRRRRAVAVISLLVALAGGVLASGISSLLSSGGWVDRASESYTVAERLASEYGGGRSRVVVVYLGPDGTDARSEAFQAQVEASLAELAAHPLVAGVAGYAQFPDDRFISLDGAGAFVIVDLSIEDEQAIDSVDHLRDLIGPIEGVEIGLTGFAPLSHAASQISERDLQRAELFSLPLALVILVAVFSSFVAAGMPLLVAGLAIPSTLGLVALLAAQTEMSIYVLNVATMLGLALAIDYSLFLVSRFREELSHGRSTGQAVERAVATAGKAVVFSALAVAIGLSGLLFFRSSALTSMGVAGIIVVAASAGFATTFLPAVLGMLGPRVNALSVSALLGRVGLRGKLFDDQGSAVTRARWERVANWVMRHPVRVFVPTLIFLLILGLPFLQIRQAVPDAAVFPVGVESRDAFVALEERFTPGETRPIIVLADVEGDPTDPVNVVALADYAAALGGVEGISRVRSPFSDLRNPINDELLTREQIVEAWAQPALRDLLQPLADEYIRGSTVRLDAITPLEAADPGTAALVHAVRGIDAGGSISLSVGGGAPGTEDFLEAMAERTPFMLVTVIVGMLIALFLLFGSVVLPVKAVIMTLLSLTASFGALVWIFQEGNFAGLLGFESPGYTVAGNPIIMFAILVGLSMDYEVLLLSRIQEAYRRTGDNTRAVAEGLSRTAGVITGAASIMVVVFAAFALADTITIKSIGVGMAIAVLLDATVIRVLLVPATMRLLGDWNWWAPGPLRRLADRVGFSHVEDDDDAADVSLGPGSRPARTTGT